jgi:nitroreductase
MSIIYERRSIRKYMNKPVPEETITQILKAGMAAPSAGNEQPWHFIVIRDRGLLDKIPEFHPYSQMLGQVNVAIVVCGDPKLEKYKGFWVQDCSAAMENMLLMAVELGLGSVWLGVYPLEDRILGLRTLLKLPDHILPLSILPIGYPAESKEPSERFDQSRVHNDQW